MAEEIAFDSAVKVMLIGSAECGKTALLRAFSREPFIEEYSPTIGIDARAMVMDFGGRHVRVQVWDTSGQERFRPITRSFYNVAHAICIVYDSSSAASFEAAVPFARDARSMGRDGVEPVLVATKSDLPSAVSAEAVQELCTSVDEEMPQFAVSGKTGDGVQQLFQAIVEKMYMKERERLRERHAHVRAAAYSSKPLDMPIRAWLNCLKPKLATRFADAFESDGIATLATLLSRDVSEELLLRLGVDVIGAQELLMGAVAAERRAHAL